MMGSSLRGLLVLALVLSACEAEDGGGIEIQEDASTGAGGTGGEGAAGAGGGGTGGEGGVAGAGAEGGAGGGGGGAGAGAEGGSGGEGGVAGAAGQGGSGGEAGGGGAVGGTGGAPPDRDATVEPDPDMSPPPDPDMAPPPDPDMAPPPEPDMAPPPEPDMAPPPEPDMSPPDMEVVNDRLFSFFVTSLDGMRRLSGSQNGFGGNLGGLEGADRICQQLAEGVGAGHKTWRAFLSVTRGPNGQPINAIDRVGAGPWYDANGRLISQNLQGLLGERPAGDPAAVNDLPDENGLPLRMLGDSHDVLTGSNQQGRLNNAALASTCNDWTSASGNVGREQVMCGHSWPRDPRSGRRWIADHTVRGCAPGVNLVQNGPGVGDCVGCGGGWGAVYCFALTP